jgi:MerR family copper efflux transcriptional regulator
MRIGELARQAGVSVRVLRHYEAQGLIQSQRLANGYRDYPSATADQVRWIRDLIDCGFGTRQIQGFLHCFRNENFDPEQCAAGLAQHLEKQRELDEMIAVLTERRHRLSERIALFGDLSSATRSQEVS